jgi:hypothetical protein
MRLAPVCETAETGRIRIPALRSRAEAQWAAARNDSAGPSWWTNPLEWRRAACRNRTDDLLITSEMLYRLS